MSKEVMDFLLKDKGGNVLYRDGTNGDCLGCMQCKVDGLINPEGRTLEVEFDETVEFPIDHPMIQALIPGATVREIGLRDEYQYTHGVVTIPDIHQVPFDQVVCALRILRHYDSWGQFERYNLSRPSANQDGAVPIIAIRHALLEDNSDKMKEEGWSRLDATFPTPATATPWTEEQAKEALERLSKGQINTGVLPPITVCGGYAKCWESVPPELFLNENKFEEDERSVLGFFDQTFWDYYRDYVKEYGDVNYTVDHAICVLGEGRING